MFNIIFTSIIILATVSTAVYRSSFSSYERQTRVLRTRDIFRTLVCSEPEAYSEPWFIQGIGIFRIRDIFRTLSKSYHGAFCKTS